MIAHTAQTVVIDLAKVRKIIGWTPIIRLFGIWIRRTKTTHSCIVAEYGMGQSLKERIGLIDILRCQEITLHRIPEILTPW